MKVPQWSGETCQESWQDWVLPLILERYQSESQVRSTLKSAAVKRFFMERHNFRTIPEEIIRSLCSRIAEDTTSKEFQDKETNFWLTQKYAWSQDQTSWFIQYFLDELIGLYLLEADWERPKLQVLEEWDPGETQCRARWVYDREGNIRSQEMLSPPPEIQPSENAPLLQDLTLREGQPRQVTAVILSAERLPLYRTVNPGILRRDSEFSPLVWHGKGPGTTVAVYRTKLFTPSA